jgi:hypothetical protein
MKRATYSEFIQATIQARKRSSRHIVIGRHPIETDNEIAFVKQALGQVKADEAAGAGDEVAHGQAFTGVSMPGRPMLEY